MSEVTHACPPRGSGVMPCCGQTPWEVPSTDRMTLEAERVTCGGPTWVPCAVCSALVLKEDAGLHHEWHRTMTNLPRGGTDGDRARA